jgi:hypothetical protein
LDILAPPEQSPEETRRQTEEFLERWVGDVIREAHAARDARARGEPEQRTPDQMSGVQIMGAACSFRGHPPPEAIRAAVWKLTHEEEVPGVIPSALMEKYNACAQVVMQRAIDRFIAETGSSARGEA